MIGFAIGGLIVFPIACTYLASITSLPSCYFDSSRKPVLFELHSSLAYEAVVYLRMVYKDGGMLSTIVASKTRVASAKTQTIPILEL